MGKKRIEMRNSWTDRNEGLISLAIYLQDYKSVIETLLKEKHITV